MVVSLVAACILPFWLFIFSYAVLGPLHYLTELGWLNKKKFFTTGRYDFLPLILIGLTWASLYIFLTAFDELKPSLKVEMLGEDWGESFTTMARKMNDVLLAGLVGGFVMALVKKWWIKTLALVVGFTVGAIMTANDVEGHRLIIGVLLPTLIHVFIFTGLFMLYGAIKSKSKVGYIGVGFLVACGAACFIIPATSAFGASGFGFDNYTDLSFDSVNRVIYNFGADRGDWITDSDKLFSGYGLQLQRFIAFAYTYHYLNWFSKTSIIGWHKVPLVNLITALILWVGSVVLYFYNYKYGLRALLTLSILHVVLEFPLNAMSIKGIFNGLFVKSKA
jgi:hypothetical protein